MEKNVVGQFIRWLEQASTEEIAAHGKRVQAAASQVTTAYGKQQIRIVQTLMDEEILARLEVSRAKQQA